MGRGKRRQRWYERAAADFTSFVNTDQPHTDGDGWGCTFVARSCRGDVTLWRSPEGTFCLALCDHHTTRFMPHAAGYAEVSADVRDTSHLSGTA